MFNIVQRITRNISFVVDCRDDGKSLKLWQVICLSLCSVLFVCALVEEPAAIWSVLFIGLAVVSADEEDNDKIFEKEKKLASEFTTELNNWLIPLIKENIPESIEAFATNVFDKYQDVFIQHKCKNEDEFLEKYYYPRSGSHLVYKYAIPPYSNSMITYISKYAPGRVGTGFKIRINDKTFNVDSLSNYKQRHDNVEFAKLVQEVYDVKKEQEEQEEQERYGYCTDEVLNVFKKIQPILKQNAEKLLKAKQILKELNNSKVMGLKFVGYRQIAQCRQIAQILNMIFYNHLNKYITINNN